MAMSGWKPRIAVICSLIIGSIILGQEPCRAEDLAVRLVVNPRTTDVQLGSGPIALTVLAKGKNLTYRWKLTGPGKLDGQGSSVFYVLPETIAEDPVQALVSVTVVEVSGQEMTETAAFSIHAAKAADKEGLSTTTKWLIGGGAGIVAVGAAVALSSGGSDDKDLDISGTWNFVSPVLNMTLNVVQVGSIYTATASGENGWVTGVSGTIDGTAITMEITFWGDYSFSAVGAVNDSSTTATGSYDYRDAGTHYTGSWSMTR
jgi:hypothetical protein